MYKKGRTGVAVYNQTSACSPPCQWRSQGGDVVKFKARFNPFGLVVSHIATAVNNLINSLHTCNLDATHSAAKLLSYTVITTHFHMSS